ncbi:glycosyltransferase family 4 protein [Chamaesiphon sp. GL140_3_metabinner_50]|uniref:glycosyltransferase family 4 protein n=1 Tax=Chamaesiphon sp. GL140_3_metabinner_50 TaxID=2970812 RepID=UPI0025F6A364|nr:glycosyltransferase family 4 protein [Chamaesiphon sp. GL140_3_metabinner_50]
MNIPAIPTRLKILILSTPVGALGSGLGGGVELTIANLARELQSRGHTIGIIAPAGSKLGDLSIIQIPGELQLTAQTQELAASIVMPSNPVLANMWAKARTIQHDYDIIFNTAFDWLPFYLTPFFDRPIAHFVSMGSQIAAIDLAIERVATGYPGTIGVCTRTQADTFKFADACHVVGGSGVDPAAYEYCEAPEAALAWLGRISPEKALEDAVAAAQRTGLKLKIMGKIQDVAYWEQIQRDYPHAPIEYLGFLPTHELQQALRTCRGLLMTPRWVEAFGNVAIEALACGVPVIAYRRGGPAEIITDGKTGFLVEPDSIEGLVAAIDRLDEIDRSACRHAAETVFSQSAWGDVMESWFYKLTLRLRITKGETTPTVQEVKS